MTERPNPEYLEVSEGIEEELSEDGSALIVRKKKLYHGSTSADIQRFNVAENQTIGNGIYLTDQESAEQYAHLRAAENTESKPILYEVLLENLRIADLRNDQILRIVLSSFKKRLEEVLKEVNLSWYRQNVAQQSLDNINNGLINAGNIRDLAFNFPLEFSQTLTDLGYDGLIAIEGGEYGMVNMKDHVTYVIFDPEKAKIENQRILN